MDQKKTGSFLKELRKENGLTQEQAAEKLSISARTVSRWETGAYMPDISMLVDIAELYGADVREIIDGERKYEMNSEVREVAEKMADYSDNEKKDVLRWIRGTSIVMTLLSLLTMVLFIIRSVRLNDILEDLLTSSIYDPGEPLIPLGLFSSLLLPTCLTILSALITLYTNGRLNNVEDSRTVCNVVRIITIIAVIFAVAGFIAGLFGEPLFIEFQRFNV